MVQKSFIWKPFRGLSPQQRDSLWYVGLLLAACVLYWANLGGLPLRDWDEGTVAQIAREIWRAPLGSLTWLYPKIAGEPYFNKPPLMHWLIALAYRVGGVNEWTARLPGATLTAFSVPLLYGIGRELFLKRTPAVLAACVYLTLLPMVRHGRLAMLDGAVVCFFLLMVFCLLRSRRDLRWGLGVGIALGLLCLTKGFVALLLGAIAVLFLLWDTPRLLTTGYLWAGILIGVAPVTGWYAAQYSHYGQPFIDTNLVNQSLGRVWHSVENNTGPPWYYVLEILKYAQPWLMFLPWGFYLSWENRSLSWAKLVLVWIGAYLPVISLMGTKLPWYVLLVYPALALVAGVKLAEVWQIEDLFGMRTLTNQRYPKAWTVLLGLSAIAAWVGCVYFSGLSAVPKLDLSVIFAAAGLTMTAAAVLTYQQDSQFIPVLIWGCYVALLLLMLSPYWVWELNEAYPVKPVAAMIQRYVPPGQVVLTSYPQGRPSLDFYSDRRVVSASLETIKSQWQQPIQPYLLVDKPFLETAHLEACQTVASAEGWVLVTRLVPTVTK